MAVKNFTGALSKQRTNKTSGTAGVIGDSPGPVREIIEQVAEQLLVQEIDIERLHDNPFQHLARPLIDEEALEDLAGSIRENGFYGALLARHRRNTADQYEIAFGHRRREAARRAGLKTLPVKVMELTDLQMAQLMASENFSREDLTPLGEANIVGHLYTVQNMSVEEVAAAIGKKRGWVQPRLALYNAPQDVKQMVEQKPETLSHARLLQQIKDQSQRASLIEQIIHNGLTFEQLNAYLGNSKTARTQNKPNIDSETTGHITNVNTDINHNQPTEQNQAIKNVKDFTSHISDVSNAGGFHNVSQETKALAVDPLLTTQRLQRSELLRRIEKATDKFDKLARQQNYKLAQDERSYLSDLIDRLKAILER